MKVRVEVYDRYIFQDAYIEIGEDVFRKVSMPLDHPNPDADLIARRLCTDPVTIKMVMNNREKLSKEISTAVTELLMDIFASKDTVMGYKTVKRIR